MIEDDLSRKTPTILRRVRFAFQLPSFDDDLDAALALDLMPNTERLQIMQDETAVWTRD